MTHSWAPDDGHTVSRNMLSNYYNELKNTKSDIYLVQPRQKLTQGYKITQSWAPDDGYTVARKMLSNY